MAGKRIGKRVRVNGRLYEEYKWPSDGPGEAAALSRRLMDLGHRVVKGSYSLSAEDHCRRISEALAFARAVKRDKRLFKAVRDNFDEVYAILENENFHVENLGLEALFDRREFLRDAGTILESALRDL